MNEEQPPTEPVNSSDTCAPVGFGIDADRTGSKEPDAQPETAHEKASDTCGLVEPGVDSEEQGSIGTEQCKRSSSHKLTVEDYVVPTARHPLPPPEPAELPALTPLITITPSKEPPGEQDMRNENKQLGSPRSRPGSARSRTGSAGSQSALLAPEHIPAKSPSKRSKGEAPGGKEEEEAPVRPGSRTSLAPERGSQVRFGSRASIVSGGEDPAKRGSRALLVPGGEAPVHPGGRASLSKRASMVRPGDKRRSLVPGQRPSIGRRASMAPRPSMGQRASLAPGAAGALPADLMALWKPPPPHKNPPRALDVLKSFEVFSEMGQEILKQLSLVAEFVHEKQGKLLFQQGDPPGSCFIVMSGEVGIWINRDILKEAQEKSKTTALNRALGDCVRVLGAGCLVGELSLLKGAPRSASIKCEKDSEFLVISPENFDRILKDDMVRRGDDRMKFLMAHLPGLAQLPPIRSGAKKDLHASYFFKKVVYPLGHTFLNQGAPTQDVIYVVAKGSVELWRRRPQQEHRPKSSPLEGGRPVISMMSRSAGSLPKLSLGLGSFHKKSSSMLSFGQLVEGGVFGHLSGMPPCLFTVVAASAPCELWMSTGSDLERLPLAVHSKVKDYIMRASDWRLHYMDSYAEHQGTVKHGLHAVASAPSL